MADVVRRLTVNQFYKGSTPFAPINKYNEYT